LNSEEQLIVCDLGSFDVPQLEEIRPPVPNMDDGFHLAPSLSTP
jgi:hypothetical protein